MNFTTDISLIKKRIQQIDPVAYGTSRNYLDGSVTYLSPYISRGVVSTSAIAKSILSKGYPSHQVIRLIQELAWRDYYQRVWQQLGDEIFDDIRVSRDSIRTAKIPTAIIKGDTGIEAIDQGIQSLYQTGYLHNHLRMYISSVICNLAKSHWKQPAQWLYYHLLDGDLASNALSWQWVAGTFSSKKYYCNQENINRYCNTNQQGTFLDHPYIDLPGLAIPAILQDTMSLTLTTTLPQKSVPTIDTSCPTLLYHSYHLDPDWKKDWKANRILVLEPSHFREFPVSEKVIAFILELSKQIDGIQVFVGEVGELSALIKSNKVYTKEHPAFAHFPGIKEDRDWLVPSLQGHFKSFFDYWKKAEKHLFPDLQKAQNSNQPIPTTGALSL